MIQAKFLNNAVLDQISEFKFVAINLKSQGSSNPCWLKLLKLVFVCGCGYKINISLCFRSSSKTASIKATPQLNVLASIMIQYLHCNRSYIFNVITSYLRKITTTQDSVINGNYFCAGRFRNASHIEAQETLDISTQLDTARHNAGVQKLMNSSSPVQKKMRNDRC